LFRNYGIIELRELIMRTQLIIALKYLIVMTVLTGVSYPLLMTGIAKITYPSRSNGSLIVRDGKVIGSELIGQKFDSCIYFWTRPSATGYNPLPSGASNYGPTSDTLRKLVNARRILFTTLNSISDESAVPKEMLFASASGIDPHISPEAALMQINRISETRHFTPGQKEKLIERVRELTEPPQFLFLGEERINVLILNIDLDLIQDYPNQ
jgi:potassium-transporting ATPase KdpC subunit